MVGRHASLLWDRWLRGASFATSSVRRCAPGHFGPKHLVDAVHAVGVCRSAAITAIHDTAALFLVPSRIISWTTRHFDTVDAGFYGHLHIQLSIVTGRRDQCSLSSTTAPRRRIAGIANVAKPTLFSGERGAAHSQRSTTKPTPTPARASDALGGKGLRGHKGAVVEKVDSQLSSQGVFRFFASPWT